MRGADVLRLIQPTSDAGNFSAFYSFLRFGWIMTNPKASEFEQALAKYHKGGSYMRACGSVTSDLEDALLAANSWRGDDVVVPAMSFVSSAYAVLPVEAHPIFA